MHVCNSWNMNSVWYNVKQYRDLGSLQGSTTHWKKQNILEYIPLIISFSQVEPSSSMCSKLFIKKRYQNIDCTHLSCHCWFKMPFVMKDSPVTLNVVFPARALALIYAKWNYTCVLIPPPLPKQRASVFSCHNNLSCLVHRTGTHRLLATSA